MYKIVGSDVFLALSAIFSIVKGDCEQAGYELLLTIYPCELKGSRSPVTLCISPLALHQSCINYLLVSKAQNNVSKC